MRRLHCDGIHCSNTDRVARYENGPPDWLIVEQGAEDELAFCGWGCLATYAAHEEIKHEH